MTGPAPKADRENVEKPMKSDRANITHQQHFVANDIQYLVSIKPPQHTVASLLIRPRLTDYHWIHAAQIDLDFAIPFLYEDIPLHLDPFMLWRSPSQHDHGLHTGLINAFNRLGVLAAQGKEAQAIETLIIASECDEACLGRSLTRKGKRIGADKAREIIDLIRGDSALSTERFQAL